MRCTLRFFCLFALGKRKLWQWRINYWHCASVSVTKSGNQLHGVIQVAVTELSNYVDLDLELAPLWVQERGPKVNIPIVNILTLIISLTCLWIHSNSSIKCALPPSLLTSSPACYHWIHWSHWFIDPLSTGLLCIILLYHGLIVYLFMYCHANIRPL